MTLAWVVQLEATSDDLEKLLVWAEVVQHENLVEAHERTAQEAMEKEQAAQNSLMESRARKVIYPS